MGVKGDWQGEIKTPSSFEVKQQAGNLLGNV